MRPALTQTWIAKANPRAQSRHVKQIAAALIDQQRRIALLLFCLFALAAPANAQETVREDLRIPMPQAGERGLQALFIRPAAPGRYPLVVFSHGAPRDSERRRKMSPYQSLPVAMEFVRRGYAVAIVMRRGYGTSGGEYSEGVACERDGNFTASGQIAASDIRAAFEFLAKRSDVDPDIMIAAGESAGGFSSIALSANPPRGLKAVINFAGGRGSTAAFQICQQEKLVQAFTNYGRTSRVPTLWIYAQNDTFFEPRVAEQFHRAFVNAGGNAEYIRHPSFGNDGHSFVYRGIELWTPYIDSFLRTNKLPRREELLPVAVSALPPPPRLSENGLRHFRDFLNAGPNKAFAVASDGAFGWQSGMNSRDEAISRALERCKQFASDCRIYIVNDEVVRRLSPAAPGSSR